MYGALIDNWAKEQGFETWASDHATVLRNMAKWMDKNAPHTEPAYDHALFAVVPDKPWPHPESRDNDIETARQTIMELSQALRADQPNLTAWSKAGLAALSRLSILELETLEVSHESV